MDWGEKYISLKDGSTALLRAPRTSDAADMLAFVRAAARESDWLISEPEEFDDFDTEKEKQYIENALRSEHGLMLACFSDKGLVGTCQIAYSRPQKTRHRARIALAVRKHCWNLGIGTAMIETLKEHARLRGVERLELSYIEGNERGRRLYEKLGFRETGRNPDAFHLNDGRRQAEVLMVCTL